ncbi:MAG: hypothetical protein KJ955_04570 [Nanoarchaeota archaeon]|nr:hypothetical protein [Nanoarchaeota archaeon]
MNNISLNRRESGVLGQMRGNGGGCYSLMAFFLGFIGCLWAFFIFAFLFSSDTFHFSGFAEKMPVFFQKRI